MKSGNFLWEKSDFSVICFYFIVIVCEKQPRSQRKLAGKNCLVTGSADLMMVNRGSTASAQLVLLEALGTVLH